MAGFDVEAARKDGYSDSEILSHLTKTRKFDVEGAHKEGYSDADIIQHLSAAPSIGIRPASGFEEVKSRFSQLLHDPLGTLSEKFTDPKGVPYSGENDPLSEAVIGGYGVPKSPPGQVMQQLFKNPPNLKGAGRITRTVKAVQSARKDAKQASELGTQARQAAERFDEMISQAPVKAPTASAKPVPKTGSGRPLTEDELAFQSAPQEPATPLEPYTPPPAKPPRPVVRVEPSVRVVPEAPPIPPPAGYVRKAPIKLNYPPAEYPIHPTPLAKIGPEATPAPSGLPKEVSDAVAEGAKRKAAGIGYTPPPAKAPDVAAGVDEITGVPVVKAGTETPVGTTATETAPGPIQTGEIASRPTKAPRVRSTPEAQQRADEIADRILEVKSVPLANQAVADGVTSKDLAALTDEQRAVFMKKIGLAPSSRKVSYKGKEMDLAWHKFLGHVQTIEKLKK